MKNQVLKTTIVMFFFLAFTASSKAQNQRSTQGIYQGYNGSGYTFAISNSGKKEIMIFQEIVPDVLHEFDLKSDVQKNKAFQIKYTETIEELGSDNNDSTTRYAIIDLKYINE